MLSGIGLTATFDWDDQRITYDSMRKNFDELELMRRLRIDTIYCDDCGHRLIIDCRIDGVIYCGCAENTCEAKANRAAKVKSSLTIVCLKQQWQPYLERPNVIVWRREEKPGLYAYKGIKAIETNANALLLSVPCPKCIFHPLSPLRFKISLCTV